MDILPNPEGVDKGWFPLAALTDGSRLPYSDVQQATLGQTLKSMLAAYVAHDAAGWNGAVLGFAPILRGDLSGGKYPSIDMLKRENFFNRLRPFHWAWILYTLAFVCLLVFNAGRESRISVPMKYIGATALLCAFGLHAGGFLLRCAVAGRPPVTNMYESIMWVTWGCVLFSLIVLGRVQERHHPDRGERVCHRGAGSRR